MPLPGILLLQAVIWNLVHSLFCKPSMNQLPESVSEEAQKEGASQASKKRHLSEGSEGNADKRSRDSQEQGADGFNQAAQSDFSKNSHLAPKVSFQPTFSATLPEPTPEEAVEDEPVVADSLLDAAPAAAPAHDNDSPVQKNPYFAVNTAPPLSTHTQEVAAGAPDDDEDDWEDEEDAGEEKKSGASAGLDDNDAEDTDAAASTDAADAADGAQQDEDGEDGEDGDTEESELQSEILKFQKETSPIPRRRIFGSTNRYAARDIANYQDHYPAFRVCPPLCKYIFL